MTFTKAQKFSFKESIEYQKDAIVSKQIIKSGAGNVTIFAFDQGQGLSEHSSPSDALVHIIDGKVKILIGGESSILNEGDNIILPANIPHALNGIEQFKMLLTLIKTS